MAEFAINELGVSKAAAIHDGDPYTEGLARVFADSFEELGGEIVAFEAEAADASNVEPLLTTVAAAGKSGRFLPKEGVDPGRAIVLPARPAKRQSGEGFTDYQAAWTPDRTGFHTLTVEVDPDRRTGDQNRGNNRASVRVPVVWTERRYVRKPRKAAPGIAVCLREQSIFVEPGVGAGVVAN